MKYSLLIMKARSIRRIKIIQKKNIYSWSLLVLLPKSYSWHFLFLLCTFLVANCILKTIWSLVSFFKFILGQCQGRLVPIILF